MVLVMLLLEAILAHIPTIVVKKLPKVRRLFVFCARNCILAPIKMSRAEVIVLMLLRLLVNAGRMNGAV